MLKKSMQKLRINKNKWSKKKTLSYSENVQLRIITN